MKPTLDLSRIKMDRLKPHEYYRQAHPKRQIYLHHTVSHPSPVNDINSWRSLGYRIGTWLLIAGKPYPQETYYEDGDIYQTFSSKYWALHLASHARYNRIPAKYKQRSHTRWLERHSVGIEICNAGWLTWENGKFYSSFRKVIPVEQVIEYVDKYRGKRFYHKYTEAQIETLRQILVFLCERYSIPMTYFENMWDISEDALKGDPGIFTHTSVRSDKTDCHPQPELVEMLRNLSKVEEEEPPTIDRIETPVVLNTVADPREDDPAAPSSPVEEDFVPRAGYSWVDAQQEAPQDSDSDAANTPEEDGGADADNPLAAAGLPSIHEDNLPELDTTPNIAGAEDDGIIHASQPANDSDTDDEDAEGPSKLLASNDDDDADDDENLSRAERRRRRREEGHDDSANA